MADPISNKVSNGGALGIATSVVSAALIYFIPAWQSGIPQFAQLLITGGLGAVGYFGGGYLSKHKATVTEITTALDEIAALEQVISKAKAPQMVTVHGTLGGQGSSSGVTVVPGSGGVGSVGGGAGSP